MFAPPPPDKELNLPGPKIPQITITELSPAEVQLANEPWKPFNDAQHEARMNLWLINQQKLTNAKLIQAYMLRYMDWKTNAEIYDRLGMDIPDPPASPKLSNIGPMPKGYWFGNH